MRRTSAMRFGLSPVTTIGRGQALFVVGHVCRGVCCGFAPFDSFGLGGKNC